VGIGNPNVRSPDIFPYSHSMEKRGIGGYLNRVSSIVYPSVNSFIPFGMVEVVEDRSGGHLVRQLRPRYVR
jgi:hypothetical protein